MSLRFIPPSGNATQTTNLTTRQQGPPSKGAPSAPGLPDTLRNKLTLPASATASSTNVGSEIPSSTHPLEARLLSWRATQEAMKMQGLRRAYGIAEPVRRGMELKIVRDGTFRPAVLGDDLREPPSFHDEMEKRLKMDF
ncbi:hypothetical protein N7461_002229 [Penicillium sp. DV-2018c]|nr:hypothetical protein N7461_002229 [Penicillium sp. DV-2018c]